MKVDIVKQVEVSTTIDVEFPYYYKYALEVDHADIVLYGKIVEDYSVRITTTTEWGNTVLGRGPNKANIEVNKRKLTDPSYYFAEEYKSNEAEFLKAKAAAQALLDKA